MTADEVLKLFPVGSSVQLKSGGPKMTVVEVVTWWNAAGGSYPKVRCEWFQGNSSSLGDNWFLPMTIQKA